MVIFQLHSDKNYKAKLFFFRWCFPYFWLPSLCPSLWSLLSRWRFEKSKIKHDSITKKTIFDCCKNVGLRSCLATSTKLKSYLRFLLKGGAGVWASSDVQVVTNFKNISPPFLQWLLLKDVSFVPLFPLRTMVSLIMPPCMKYDNFLFDFIFRLGLLLTGGARGPGVHFLLWLFMNHKDDDLDDLSDTQWCCWERHCGRWWFW